MTSRRNVQRRDGKGRAEYGGGTGGQRRRGQTSGRLLLYVLVRAWPWQERPLQQEVTLHRVPSRHGDLVGLADGLLALLSALKSILSGQDETGTE